MTPYDGYLPEGVVYLPKAITDHGVPRDAAYMAEIVGALAALLAAGRRLYLHCRAGIGRTWLGTTPRCRITS